MTTTGDIIKKYREDNKIKAKDLAALLGVSPAYLSHLENNRKKITTDLLRKLVDITNIDYSFWLSEKNYALDRRKMKNTAKLIDTLIENRLVKKEEDILNETFREVLDYALVADTKHKLEIYEIEMKEEK